MASLTLATFNCRGMSRRPKQAEILQLASSKNIDILVLQETYIHRLGQIRSFDRTFGTRSYWSYGASGSRGVGIILMPRFRGSVLRHSRDAEGRVLSVDLDSGIRIVNIYAPNRGRDLGAFFKHLDSQLIGPSKLVLVGDFNCVLDRADRLSFRGTPPKERDRQGARALRELVEELDLVDAWKVLRSGQSGMTWTGRRLQSRLDRFYVSPTLASGMHSMWSVPSALSDHKCVILRFSDGILVPREKGTWRLNSRLLEDQEVVKEVSGILRNSLQSNLGLDGVGWDGIKADVRDCFKAAGMRRAREERQEITIVSDVILLLSKPLSAGQGVTEALASQRIRLRKLLQQRWDGLRAMARAERWEREHWCSRHLLRRRLARTETSLTELVDPVTGSISNTPDAVLKATRQFYSVLYQAPAPTTATFPLESPSKPVHLSGAPLDETELEAALKSFHRNRSPGSDGLTVEFYVKFWKQLGKPFTALVNRLLGEGTLSGTQREGRITLLCKDESRRTDLRAWRPITLLNVDYKLIAKCLSSRLTSFLPDIIGPYQACSVPGRSTQLHGFALRDLFLWAQHRNLQGILCSFDQEKAFDVVSHSYLFQVLEEAGIDSDFQRMVRALYTRPVSAVTVLGRTSEVFDVGRGVRQGCPLSPALYVLAFEPLLQRLSRDSRIARFPLPPGSPPAPIFAYADDLTIVVPDEASVSSVLDVMEVYCKASGAKVNRSKSATLYFGCAPSSPQPAHGLPVKAEVRLLGFYFNSQGLSDRNWSSAQEKIESRAREYEKLLCPLTARATITRSLLFSVLTYVAGVTPLSARTKLHLERILFRFLWSGAPDKVKRLVVKLPRERGGLGISDLGIVASALHVRWTQVALNSDMPLTQSLTSFFLSTRLRLFAQSTYSHCVPRSGSPSPFYAQAATCLERLRKEEADIDVVSVPLKELVRLLTPSLPPHLRLYDLANVKPSWRYITADFLEASRASFMYRFARGVLPIKAPAFTRTSLRPTCPTCGGREDTVHIFSQCLLPEALLRRVANLFQLPGIPYQTVQYLNPLPGVAVNQFVLLLVECAYQVWLARCAAAYNSRVPGLHEVIAKVRKEVWFCLQRERRILGEQRFSKIWCGPSVIFSVKGGTLSVSL